MANISVRENGGAGVPCLIAAATVVITLYLSRSGLDFTDEGFYLASIANPDKYVTSFSFFGHVYRLAYDILEGSIAGLRVFNLGVTYLLAFSLSYLVVRRYLWNGGRFLAPAAAAGALAVVSLLTVSLQGKWVATPSYNSLAFAGCLLVSIGATLCSLTGQRRSLTGWLLLAIGGWATFMGKPTTAVMIAAATFVLLLACRSLELRGAVLTLVVALMLVVSSALAISGSVTAFVDRVVFTLSLLKIQQSGHDMSDALFRSASIPTGVRAISLYVLATALSFGSWQAGTKHSITIVRLLFVGAFMGAITFQWMGIGQVYAKEAFIQLMLLGALVVGAFLLIVGQRFEVVGESLRQRFALGVYFLALPHVYAFGTNTDYLVQASTVGFFWVIGSLLLMSAFFNAERLRILVPLYSLASAGFAFFMVLIIADSPYRQSESLWRAYAPVVIGSQGAVLWLQPREAAFVSSLRHATDAAHLPPGQPVIDLSGKSPGVIYALGGRGVGSAWLPGGYPGSVQATAVLMTHVECAELATAWVLTGASEDSIPISVLQTVGADLDRDYAAVASWTLPLDGDQLTLFKPQLNPGEATISCHLRRSSVTPVGIQ